MDIYSSWYYEIKNDIIRIVEQENIDCVLTTSPPHSTHLFGKHLKTIYGIPWIIDLRDSLTDWPLRKKSLSTQVISCIESFYEKSFYNISDKVIFATDYMKKHAQIRRKNLSDNKAHVITNGFDPEDFEINEQYILKDDKFKITYTGTIHPKMDPRPFCNAVIHLINNKFIPANDIVIRIVGMIEKNKKSILETLADVTSIEFSGHVNHKEAIKHQLAADLLLLLVPYSKSEIEKEILTGKVFEYIGSGKPIFALTLEGELADLIKENKFGYVANPGNPDEVEATLFRAYQNWKMGESVLSDKNRGKFTRESQCKTLSNIIKEVVKQNKSGVSK
jgi:glycosyltransferase involved in cell wall biosynthesis